MLHRHPHGNRLQHLEPKLKDHYNWFISPLFLPLQKDSQRGSFEHFADQLPLFGLTWIISTYSRYARLQSHHPFSRGCVTHVLLRARGSGRPNPTLPLDLCTGAECPTP